MTSLMTAIFGLCRITFSTHFECNNIPWEPYFHEFAADWAVYGIHLYRRADTRHE